MTLAPESASADSKLARARACRGDYGRLCPGVKMGGGRIIACLNEHAAELSEQCRAALQGDGGQTPQRAAIPSGVEVMRDLAYGPDPLQRLDVYLPSHPQNAPVLLMVHGGGWVFGDKALPSTVENKVAHWAPKGFIFVSVNYRMIPAADPLEQARDVARALALVQSKAASWGGDPTKIVLMGHSAGGHLVSLLAADPGIAQGLGAKPWLGTVSLDSGAIDVVAIMRNRHFKFYDRIFGADPAFWRSASPLERLAGNGRPILLVCSTAIAASCQHTAAFAQKAAAMGTPAKVIPVSLTHKQINVSLGQNKAYTDSIEAFLRTLGLGDALPK
jgi:acetyl esterase/lipase